MPTEFFQRGRCAALTTAMALLEHMQISREHEDRMRRIGAAYDPIFNHLLYEALPPWDTREDFRRVTTTPRAARVLRAWGVVHHCKVLAQLAAAEMASDNHKRLWDSAHVPEFDKEFDIDRYIKCAQSARIVCDNPGADYTMLFAMCRCEFRWQCIDCLDAYAKINARSTGTSASADAILASHFP